MTTSERARAGHHDSHRCRRGLPAAAHCLHGRTDRLRPRQVRPAAVGLGLLPRALDQRPGAGLGSRRDDHRRRRRGPRRRPGRHPAAASVHTSWRCGSRASSSTWSPSVTTTTSRCATSGSWSARSPWLGWPSDRARYGHVDLPSATGPRVRYPGGDPRPRPPPNARPRTSCGRSASSPTTRAAPTSRSTPRRLAEAYAELLDSRRVRLHDLRQRRGVRRAGAGRAISPSSPCASTICCRSSERAPRRTFPASASWGSRSSPASSTTTLGSRRPRNVSPCRSLPDSRTAGPPRRRRGHRGRAHVHVAAWGPGPRRAHHHVLLARAPANQPGQPGGVHGTGQPRDSLSPGWTTADAQAPADCWATQRRVQAGVHALLAQRARRAGRAGRCGRGRRRPPRRRSRR